MDIFENLTMYVGKILEKIYLKIKIKSICP